MNHFTSLSRAILATICLFSMQIFAQTPEEKTTAQIKRAATTANPAVVSLTKNLFRNEEYQAPYTVQVPYQATEQYTVEIPYQVDETYTVQVPYEDTETYTENVPYTVNVPYTDYETDYRDEYQCRNVTRYRNECHNVTRYRQECHNEQKCYIVPGTGGQQCRDVQECGTNAQGQQICKTRRVCDGGDTGPQQRCDTQQVCNNVPYTDRECRDVPYNDQECSNVRVPYRREVTRYRDETRYRQETRTRTVTKYRNETRTRTVTKTRTETRTREVTKYRDEERCCVTKTRQVFDRQLSFNVEVVFPQEAQLAGNETETLTVKLVSANANTAQVQVDIVDSIYGYKVANQTANGATVQVVLSLAPKYDLTNAGLSAIKGLRIDYVAAAQKFQVSFTDAITSTRVQSAYAIVISDLASGAQIEELAVGSLANGQLGAVVTSALDSQSKIKATLKVKRSGLLIAGNEITFETSVNFEKRALIKDDVTALSDAKLLGGQVIGNGADSSFQLIDQTPEFSDLASSYDIFLTLKTADGGNQALKTTSITREALKQQGMAIKLTTVFKDAASALKSLTAGRVIKFSIHAKRKGATGGILGGKTVPVETSGRFTLQ